MSYNSQVQSFLIGDLVVFTGYEVDNPPLAHRIGIVIELGPGTKPHKADLDDAVKKIVAKAVKDEVQSVMGDKNTQDDMADISKKIIKKLYKDLSFHHPYIIDRIKI